MSLRDQSADWSWQSPAIVIIRTLIRLCRMDDIGLDIHFLSLWRKKIVVAASVCTGVSNMPPACCTAIGSSPFVQAKKENPHRMVWVLFLVDTYWLNSNLKQIQFLAGSGSRCRPYSCR